MSLIFVLLLQLCLSLDVGASDYGVELNSTNFDSLLEDTLASFAIVQFSAHWCPPCRKYKPHYEKVARLFNGPEAAHPGLLVMTRVDCALKINIELCEKFTVNHFPMLFWGTRSKFVGGSWNPKQDTSDICTIDDGRTADRLLTWINKKINSSYSLENQKLDNVSEQILRVVFDIIRDNKMLKLETWRSLMSSFLLLMASLISYTFFVHLMYEGQML